MLKKLYIVHVKRFSVIFCHLSQEKMDQNAYPNQFERERLLQNKICEPVTSLFCSTNRPASIAASRKYCVSIISALSLFRDRNYHKNKNH